MKQLLVICAVIAASLSANAQTEPTQQQLDSLRVKAIQMQVLIDETRSWITTIPDEVADHLLIERADPGPQLFNMVLSQALIALAKALPVYVKVPLAVMGGVIYEWTYAPPPGIGFQASYGKRADRTLFELRGLFARVADSPAVYWNTGYKLPTPYTVNGVTRDSVHMSELWNAHVPIYGHLDFHAYIDGIRRAWRKEIVREELIAKYRIGYPYFTSQQCTYSYHPGREPNMLFRDDWYMKSTKSNAIASGLDTKYGGKGRYESVSITPADNSERGFIKTLGKFYTSLEPTMYVKYAIDPRYPDIISYYRFHIVPKSISESECNWRLMGRNNTAVIDSVGRWLFIDDGYGNVINGDGVALRSEVYLDWELEGSAGIPRKVTVGVEEELELQQGLLVRPNPSTSWAEFLINMPSGDAEIAMFDMTGNHVMDVFRGYYAGGEAQLPIQTEELAPGMYVVRMTQQGRVITRSLMKM